MKQGRPKPDEVQAIYADLAKAYEKLKRDDLATKAREYGKMVAPAGPAGEPGDKGLRGRKKGAESEDL